MASSHAFAAQCGVWPGEPNKPEVDENTLKERSDNSLRDLLVSGGCDSCTGWEPDVFSQLRNELEKGEATLGVDAQGSVKRVVSVAKPVRRALHTSLVCLFPTHADGRCVLADCLRWD